MCALRPGDRVRLAPRERPFHDSPDWWWTVLFARPEGFDVAYGRSTSRVGVGYEKVRGVWRGGEE